MGPTKERNLKASETDENESKKRSSIRLGTLSPDPWDFTLLMPIPVDYFFLGLSCAWKLAPAWSWPRSRRSGCFPAEPCPPLRPLVVYAQPTQLRKMERKKT